MLRRVLAQPAFASGLARLHSRANPLLAEVTHIDAPAAGEKPKVAHLPADVAPPAEASPAEASAPPTPSGPIPLPKLAKPVKTPVLPLAEALKLVKTTAKGRFNESVDICFQLGIDPKRSDQAVRGVAALPHGTGKKVRVAVFADGPAAEEARRAGADLVGAEDLIATVKAGGSGAIDFDKAIATPAMMPKLSAIARVLGPRGLMPNPKLGTVTSDVTAAIAAVRKGQVQFRADKGAQVHAPLGRVSFSEEALGENAAALVAAVLAARPKAAKGGAGKAGGGGGAAGFVRWAKISTTMGKGSVTVAVPSIVAAGGAGVGGAAAAGAAAAATGGR